MESLIFFAALLVFLFGLLSAVADRSPITAPMVFVAVGVLAGPLGFDFFEVEIESQLVKTIAEVTLVLILFTDASTIHLKALKREFRIPLRLLGIGLPLTMLAGWAVAVPMFPGESLWMVAVLAFVLSPTDAALGQAVVNNKHVPGLVKDSIEVESGINDGIALPPIMVCLAALTAAAGTPLDFSYWGTYAAKQIILGVLVGGAVGWAGGALINFSVKRDWMEPVFQRLASFSLAILSYALAEKLGGNGFIAAFFGGLMLGARSKVVRSRIQEFGEAEGQQLSLFVFLIFGLVLVPEAKGHWDGMALLYALLSLTVIRMGPVAISLIGTKLDLPTVGFIGWFGPRGIASILYVLIFVSEVGKEDNERILSVIVLTILMSIFIHGLSAVPLANFYGRYAARNPHGEQSDQ
jgi:NhaP-type Na+/H+ or K+/H+ antiporter